MILVKKLHPDAVLPVSSNNTDAGYDLFAIDDGTLNEPQGYIEYRTGIAIELPRGFHAEIFPRSSISKTTLILANGVGLIDEGYRGEILLRFRYISVVPRAYKAGDRIGQLVIRKTEHMPMVWVEELGSSDRGTGGFGSTGS